MHNTFLIMQEKDLVNPKNIKILVDEDATFVETSKVVNKWLKVK